MWHEIVNTPAGRLIDALEMYRKADAVVREYVTAELLGCDTPESYDRLALAAVRQGAGSFDSQRLDVVNRNVGAILWTLRQAGVQIADPSDIATRSNSGS